MKNNNKEWDQERLRENNKYWWRWKEQDWKVKWKRLIKDNKEWEILLKNEKACEKEFKKKD